MKFNHLTIIKRAGFKESIDGDRIRRRSTWWCQCDCGNPEFIELVGTDVVSGRKKSCGCVNYSLINTRKANCKSNEYDLSGEYGIGYTYNTDKYNRNEFYFDLDDYDKIKKYCWHFNNKDGYLYTTINKNVENDKYHTIKMHRVVMGLDEYDGYKVDHIHGIESRNDNRKCNLRLANSSQNGMNHKVGSNNTSGVTGVQWHSRDQVWEAWITVDRNKIYLGRSINFDEAVKMRKDAEEKYFGKWSYDNSINYNMIKDDEQAC